MSHRALLDPPCYLEEIPEETTWASLLLWKWPVRVKGYGVGWCQNKGSLPWESPLGPFKIKAQSQTREIWVLISGIKGIPGVWRHLCSRREMEMLTVCVLLSMTMWKRHTQAHTKQPQNMSSCSVPSVTFSNWTHHILFYHKRAATFGTLHGHNKRPL